MGNELEQLIRELRGFDCIYCYGAGYVGNLVGQFLNRTGIKWNGYLVSCLGKQSTVLNGKKVQEIERLSGDRRYTFIISVYPHNVETIINSIPETLSYNMIRLNENQIVLLKESCTIFELKENLPYRELYDFRFKYAYLNIVCNVCSNQIQYDMFMRYILDVMEDKRRENKLICFVGNGGSAGIATHMTSDFMKNGRMKTHSLYESTVLTCLANDYGYEHVFSEQIMNIANEGDLLIAISSSGNSPNIIKAVEAAREKKCDVFTLSGFNEDNRLRALGDYNLYVPCNEYGIVESLHNFVLQKLVDGLIKSPINREYNGRRIDFIVELVTGRLLKIVEALEKRGFLIRLYIDKAYWSRTKELPSSVEDMLHGLYNSSYEVVEYDSEAELFEKMLASDAFVIHHFMEWRDCSLACHIISFIRDKLPAYIVEHYDMLNDMYTYICQDLLTWEQFALEHADGVVFCDCSDMYFRDKKKWSFHGLQKQFFNYNSRIYESKQKNKSDEDELSFVYAGFLETEEERPNTPYVRWMELAEICEKNQCHLHIYPSGKADDVKYEKYRNLEKNSKYFHLHKNVKFRDLPEELSRYDFGILPAGKDVYLNEINDYETREKAIYGGNNKVFDYIAAGLPVVAGWQKMFMQKFTDMGIAVMSFNEDIDFEYLKRNRCMMRKKVIEKRHYFNMEERIDELIQFYQECAEAKKQKGN